MGNDEGNNNWQDILEILTKHIKNTRSFCDITSLNVVEFCVADRGISDVIQRYINDFMSSKERQLNQKNETLSVLKRDEGNAKFKLKEYEECMVLYTEAVFLAPEKDCLPLALANRSAALFHLCKYEECLSDIDLAIAKGYPQCKSAKLMLRRSQCLQKIGQEEQCISSRDKNCSITLPLPKGGVNPLFHSASAAIGVVFTKEKGRHVVAKDDIFMGDVLFVVQPFSFIVLKDVCHGCCTSLAAPVPCWRCLDARYCRESCRAAHAPLHRYECRHLGLLSSVGIAHLALRLLLQAEPPGSLPGRTDDVPEGPVAYPDRGYQNVCGLVTHLEDMDREDLFQYAVTAVLLATYLQLHTDYMKAKGRTLDGTATGLLHHIAQLVCNGHAITRIAQRGDATVSEQFQERVATAIYPSASMMNHSCDPNVINSFHKTTLIVRAVRDIARGEEVFNCYGPHFRRMSTEERREILSSQYFFSCKCPPCIRPFDFLECFQALLCTHCRGPLLRLPLERYERLERLRAEGQLHPHLGRSPGDIDLMVCMECHRHEVVNEARSKKEYLVTRLIKEGTFSLKQNKVDTAMTKFLEAWRVGREVLYRLHKDLAFAADQVARCLALLGDYRRSALFLKCCLQTVSEQFGPSSVELGYELLKLTDVQLSHLQELRQGQPDPDHCLEIEKSCKENLNRAQIIFTSLCGPWHETVKEITEKKMKLDDGS